MRWIRRDWTPEAADDWSGEDLLAAILSAFAYLFFIVGSALSLLALSWGYLLLGAAIVFSAAMYYIIDPKLRAASSNYESKQEEYLGRLEKLVRWQRSE